MRILAITNIYPTAENSAFRPYVDEQIKSLRNIGVNVDVMYVDRAGKGMRVYLGLGRTIGKRVKDFNPDLVHCMYGGVLADQVTRKVRDRPTAVTFRGSDLYGEYFCGLLRRKIAAFGVRGSYRAARRAGGVIVVSKNLRDMLPENVDGSKVRIIPDGMDLKLFRPLNREDCRHRLKWHPDRYHILFPANSSSPVKRPYLAWGAVETARSWGIPAEIHHLSAVPHSEVPVWVNAADVLILTSWHEGSPNVVREALACNVPVISVDVGDVRERIEGIAGCYIASPDTRDLTRKLRFTYEGPRRIKGRSKIQELSLECTALRLERFYSKVLSSYQGKRVRRPHPQRVIIEKETAL